MFMNLALVMLMIGTSMLSWTKIALGKSQSRKNKQIKTQDLDPVKVVEGGIFEVVVKKKKDRASYINDPRAHMNFQQRNDPYLVIGTSFAIGNNRFVTSAHVFDLGSQSFYSDYFLRDSKKRRYRIGKFTKYDEYRNVAEFVLADPSNSHKALKISRKYRIGLEVCLPANALGERLSMRCDGNILDQIQERVGGRFPLIRFSNPSPGDNTGGPLTNHKGEVIGVILKSSPNQNIAIPIVEFLKIKRSKALFFHKGAGIRHISGVNTLKPWVFTTPLPRSGKFLRRQARISLQKHYRILLAAHDKKTRDNVYPRVKALQDYLFKQDPDYDLAMIIPKDVSRRQWGITKVSFSKAKISNQQVLKTGVQKIAGMMSFHMDKPRKLSLEKFLANPKEMLDEIVVVAGISRDVRGNKVQVKSFGPVSKQKKFKDGLGRIWHHAIWWIYYNHSILEMFYTPTPRGAYVFIKLKPLSQKNPVDLSLIKRSFERVQISYSGSSAELERFFSLGSRPEIFRHASLSADDSKIHLGMAEFKISIPRIRKIGRDYWDFKIGLNPKDPTKASLLALYYRPVASKFDTVQIRHIYAPRKSSSLSDRREFRDMMKEQSPFDGEARETTNGYETLSLISLISSSDLWVARCNALEESSAEDYCEIEAEL